MWPRRPRVRIPSITPPTRCPERLFAPGIGHSQGAAGLVVVVVDGNVVVVVVVDVEVVVVVG